MTRRRIFCCGCNGEVMARLTNGREIYPGRVALADLPFWRCDACGNYVGCHHKTRHRTKPPGVIPSPQIRNARSHIHAALDPLWKRGAIERRALYRLMADRLGLKDYHTAEISSLTEARRAWRAAREIAAELDPEVADNG